MDSIIHLEDRRILVVGASSGIGRETALLLGRMGAKVILMARNADRLNATLAEMEGEGHVVCPADVSELDQIDGVVRQIVAEGGPLDGMVYSAGVTDHIPVRLLKPERALKVFRVNFFSYLEMIRCVTQKGRFRPGMRIVGVSSIASEKGDKSHTSYSASKAAMDSAIRCIAKEVADKGICINNVAPALAATSMGNTIAENNGEQDETMKILMERQYLGLVQPVEVANAIAFLLSTASRPITGTVLKVDCGLMTN